MKRIGECKRCGKCCQMGTLLTSLHFSEKIIGGFIAQSVVAGEKEKDAREQVLKFFNGCCPSLIAGKDNTYRCSIYDERPLFCKEYPAEPADIISDDCGFRFVEEAK